MGKAHEGTVYGLARRGLESRITIIIENKVFRKKG